MKYLPLVLLLAGCAHTLPSRAPTGNHGQGQSPAAACPHQYKELVTTPDGAHVFIYCWGRRYET